MSTHQPPKALGILGGTFNPPHLGHLAVARCAREQLGLDTVLLVPSCVPPHKEAQADPGPEQRLRMCELAVTGQEGLAACPHEVRRGGPSYTVDTLQALQAQHPDATLTLILGSDMASTLPSWRAPRELLALAELAVAARAGDGEGEVRAALASLDAREPVFLQMPTVDVSSSQVRARVAAGESLEGLVAPAVAAYIAARALYRQAAEVPAR